MSRGATWAQLRSHFANSLCATSPHMARSLPQPYVPIRPHSREITQMDVGPSPTTTLESRFLDLDRPVLLSGIQALIRVLLEQKRLDRAAGLNTGGLISGYRGSPLGGLDLELWRRQKMLGERNIQFQPGVNEDLAATMLYGSQQLDAFPGKRVDGVFGMWYGKGPGVDRAGDV